MKSSGDEPFLAWPGWSHWVRGSLLYLLVTGWFVVVYGGADWFTAHHQWRIRVHFDAELSLPLIPAFAAAYMSVYLLFFAAPFVLRRREEVTALAFRQAVAIAIAGVMFLLLPARLAYSPPTDLGVWAGLFQFADRLNLDYNLVPSLHVALSAICIETYVPRAARLVGLTLRLWGAVIAASTVFTHQHHLLDVAAGYALALLVSRTDWIGIHRFRRGAVVQAG